MMSIGRGGLAAVIATGLVTAACTAASGADRVTDEWAAPLATNQSAPAARLLPRVDVGSSSLRVAVDDAIEALRNELDRVAAAEKRAAEEKARGAARRSQDPQRAEKAQATKQSDGDCAQQAMAAGQFDPTCSAYQGYLDPGTSAGRAPTSGETQMQYACEQGLIPKSDC